VHSLLKVEARAEGSVEYQPALAPPERGFGEWEVHPVRVSMRVGDSVELRANGDWMVIRPGGEWLGIAAAVGGRETAERLAVMNNGDLPTRVVNLDETESTSVHTRASVQAALEAQAAQAAG
jgi:hypothetical protein